MNEYFGRIDYIKYADYGELVTFIYNIFKENYVEINGQEILHNPISYGIEIYLNCNDKWELVNLIINATENECHLGGNVFYSQLTNNYIICSYFYDSDDPL